jgi:hypothetical protein
MERAGTSHYITRFVSASMRIIRWTHRPSLFHVQDFPRCPGMEGCLMMSLSRDLVFHPQPPFFWVPILAGRSEVLEQP